MSVLILAACLTCGNPADVSINQGGWATRGTVVHASRDRGTYIITTRHGHPVPAPWRASGGLVGRYTRHDPKADLALLWTPQYLPGQKVRTLAKAAPVRAVCRHQEGVLFIAGLRSEDGHHLLGMAGELPVGSSGSGLLDSEGRLVGVCAGATFGTTCYIPPQTITRFLKGE